MLRYFYFLGLVSIFFVSCRTTGIVRIPVPVPPQVHVPDHIQKVGVVNRSIATAGKVNKAWNIVEGVLTGEGIFEDKNGSFACIAGVASELNRDGIVESVLMDSILLPNPGAAMMPPFLKWAEVDRLCKKYGTDALLVLEKFDTDQAGSVTSESVAHTVNTIKTIANGGSVKPPPPPSGNARVYLKMGWRLYDPLNKVVLDEVQISDYFGVNGRSGNRVIDLGEFAKRDAINRSAFVGGCAYARRLVPGWTRVRREYYRRGGPDMKVATRYMEMNEFDQAMEIWDPITKNKKRKWAGRASYNMAVGFEIRKDYAAALEWAQHAYTQFREKRARNYARILKRKVR